MNKIVLITGATGAIGSATALEIAKSGATVVLLGRNQSKLENLKNKISLKTGNRNIDILVADMSDVDSVKNAAKEFKLKYYRLDVLLNIAAVYKAKRELTKNNLEMMFATNHMGPFVLTNELLFLLKMSKPSRIITLTAPSTTKINFNDLQREKRFSPLNVFGASKMMNLLFTYALARRLEGTGLTATAFFPGLTKSHLTDEMPFLIKYFVKMISSSPEKPARMLSRLALDPMYQNSNGKFYKFNEKEIKSSGYTQDETIQEKLWETSQKIEKSLRKKAEPREAILI